MGFANNVTPAWMLGRKYKIGEKVIYSDLSPWEVCTIQGYRPDLDYVVDFNDGLGDLVVNECGMRDYTPENIEKLLS